MQFDNIDFVVDSKLTIDAFNSNHHNVTESGHIIIACQNLFYSHFTNLRVEFNRRQTNVTAHVLADETTIYFDVPDSINTIIINEIM